MFRTIDGSLAALWEHMVAITADDHELLDLRPGEVEPDLETLKQVGVIEG